MQIIPVIDILKARVVRAYRGRRDDYRPVRSTLCRSARPVDVVQAFLELYPFTHVYLADLDAILGDGDNNNIMGELRQRFPGLEFWIDRGGRQARDGERLTTVLGTETGLSPDELLRARDECPQTVLSLDFNGDGFLGDETVLEQDRLWPRRCILMTLDRVGARGGPDLARLASLKQRAPGHDYYIAGGVRDGDDLARAAEAGAAGALLASALHDGRITAEILRNHTD